MKQKQRSIRPMLATFVDRPFDDEGWVFEIKLDGFRAIAILEYNQIELHSRNLLSFNDRFPLLVEELKQLRLNAVLDGEIVALNQNQIPKFQLLQNALPQTEVFFYVFDILYLNNINLQNLPLIKRKVILKENLKNTLHVRYLDFIDARGIDFFKVCQERELEGIVAKKKNSHYLEGIRSKNWLKIKNEHQQEVIICGFTEPKGGRKGFGALLVGVYKEKQLHYVGHVGGGFTQRQLNEIKTLLDPLIIEKSPFSIPPKTNTKATWVTPKYVCEVKFKESTKEGIMRQPIFLGFREDKLPNEVEEEKPIHTKKTNKKNILDAYPFLTHLDKPYWDKEKITKEDILLYYASVAKYILPYLKDRPQVLKRYPNGISKPSFYQKNLADHPSWIQTAFVEHERKTVEYLLIQDIQSLMYAVNLGCIEIHSWFSRIQNLQNPDILLFDLDPEDISFNAVIETAQSLHAILEDIKVPHFCKTSGATGLHIAVPLGAKYPFEQAKQFAQLIAIKVVEHLPEITSIERKPIHRQKKVYVDYLQNNFGQTMAMPYSVRARAGAPVSTPLVWSEVTKGLNPADFTIFNTVERINNYGDLFKKGYQKGIDLKKILEKFRAKL